MDYLPGGWFVSPWHLPFFWGWTNTGDTPWLSEHATQGFKRWQVKAKKRATAIRILLLPKEEYFPGNYSNIISSQRHFWRWSSCSQDGICEFPEVQYPLPAKKCHLRGHKNGYPGRRHRPWGPRTSSPHGTSGQSCFARSWVDSGSGANPRT